MIVFVGHPEIRQMCHCPQMADTMGHRLKELRKARKLNQIDVAAAVDIDRAYLSRLENDEKNATIAIIASLADFYDVSIDYLYKGTPTPFPSSQLNCEGPHSIEEKALIELWREMGNGQKRVFMSMISGLLKTNIA